MSKPKIEKGIPMPAGIRKSKYAWVATLEVGDSFVLPETKRYGVERVAKLCGFKLRTTALKQEPGNLRYWRAE